MLWVRIEYGSEGKRQSISNLLDLTDSLGFEMHSMKTFVKLETN